MSERPGLYEDTEELEEIFLDVDFTEMEFGNRKQYIISVQDITDRKRAEREIEKQNNLLRMALNAAEKANQAKTLFLATMTHELKTPLNSLLGYCQFLGMGQIGPLNDSQKEAVSSIESSGRHLLSLVEQILDFARMENDTIQLKVSDTDLNGLIDDALLSFKRLAEDKEIRLIRGAQNECVIRGDHTRLKQIVNNLIHNAIKYNHTGGSVKVWCEPKPDHIVFNVADNGPGIANEDQARIFDPFEQLPPDKGKKREGAGLGLSIVKRLAELHGGSISVESEPGKGSLFSVTLPLKP